MMELRSEARLSLTMSWREQLLEEAQSELLQGQGVPERQWKTMLDLARLVYFLQEELPVSEWLAMDEAEVLRGIAENKYLSAEAAERLREALRFPGVKDEALPAASWELIRIIRNQYPKADDWNWLQ